MNRQAVWVGSIWLLAPLEPIIGSGIAIGIALALFLILLLVKGGEQNNE